MRFYVRVGRVAENYVVEIEEPDGTLFARLEGRQLWTTMQAAVPYLVAAAEPDPFAELFGGIR